MRVISALALALLAATSVSGSTLATEVEGDDSSVTVEAPATDVDVSSDKVTIEAPYTDVEVDEAGRQVRIRVPYFSGDISW